MNISNFIDNVVEDYKNELYTDYKNIYNDIYEFINKSDKIILFGGTVLNCLFTKEHKIYKDNTLYDIDTLSYDPINVGKSLVKFLQKKGHKYIQFSKSAIDNVFNIRINFRNLVDIGYTEVHLFKKLVTLRNTYDSKVYANEFVNSVPVCFIFFALYKELGSFILSSHRWNKVYERYSLFIDNVVDQKLFNHAKYVKSNVSEEDSNLILELYNNIKDDDNLVIGGKLAFEKIMGNINEDFTNSYLYNSLIVCTTDYDAVLNKIQHLISINNLDVKINTFTSKISSNVVISRNGNDLMKIMHNNNYCCSYFTYKKKIKYATFVSLITILTNNMIIDDINKYGEYIHLIKRIHEVYFEKFKKYNQKFMNKTCYGNVTTIEDLRIRFWKTSVNDTIIMKSDMN